jgi:hypothetical protein
MHKILLFFFLVGGFLLETIPCRVHAQAPPNFVPSYQTVNVYDVNGHTMANATADVEGTPLFIPKWNLGLIRLVDGRIFTGVPVELDLEKQLVRYKRGDGSEEEVQPGLVSQVIILDTVGHANLTYPFVSG